MHGSVTTFSLLHSPAGPAAPLCIAFATFKIKEFAIPKCVCHRELTRTLWCSITEDVIWNGECTITPVCLPYIIHCVSTRSKQLHGIITVSSWNVCSDLWQWSNVVWADLGANMIITMVRRTEIEAFCFNDSIGSFRKHALLFVCFLCQAHSLFKPN